MDEAEQLHAVLESTAERLAGVLEGARFERRDGYSFMAFPTFPIRDINGVWVHTDAAAPHLEDALAEARELETPFSVMVRAGKTPAVEEAAQRLGLTSTAEIPGMAVTPGELRDPAVPGVEVIRVRPPTGWLRRSL